MTCDQYVSFHLAEHLYGIPIRDVQEVLPARTMSPVPLAGADVAGLVNLRGQVVLALDLRARLGLPAAPAERMLVVVTAGPDPGALLVDHVGEVVEVSGHQCEPPPGTLAAPLRSLLRGTYKLDGRLLLALDVHAATT